MKPNAKLNNATASNDRQAGRSSEEWKRSDVTPINRESTVEKVVGAWKR